MGIFEAPALYFFGSHPFVNQFGMLSLSYPKFGTTYPGTEACKAPRNLAKTPKPETNPFPIGAKIALRWLHSSSNVYLLVPFTTRILIYIAAYSTRICQPSRPQIHRCSLQCRQTHLMELQKQRHLAPITIRKGSRLLRNLNRHRRRVKTERF